MLRTMQAGKKMFRPPYHAARIAATPNCGRKENCGAMARITPSIKKEFRNCDILGSMNENRGKKSMNVKRPFDESTVTSIE